MDKLFEFNEEINKLVTENQLLEQLLYAFSFRSIFMFILLFWLLVLGQKYSLLKDKLDVNRGYALMCFILNICCWCSLKKDENESKTNIEDHNQHKHKEQHNEKDTKTIKNN